MSRTIKILLAIFVIAVGLLAAVPNPHCHCRDSKPIQTLKDDCPFGKLRFLSGSLDTAPQLSFDLNQTFAEQEVQYSYLVRLAEVGNSSSARDPPFPRES